MTFTWNQVRDVVDAALALVPDERERYLQQVCPDPALRKYADSIILSYDRAGSFLEEPAWEKQKKFWDSAEAEESWIGKRLGPYELIEEIGSGGMGAVYRAVRADDQYKKQVAIKVIKSGFETAFALNRFRTERQILANLEHPNIARLLDGGTTDRSLPYFVMELVEGQPIDQYCDERKLTLRERLHLFCAACSAVEYAHQNLIVHRDLKPGNILITKDGMPKLLDFGIAKILTSEPASREAEPSVAFLRILTPEYASPEQITGATISTSTDVYSLGVVFYILLTGHRPYEVDTQRPDKMLQTICELEPARPSLIVREKRKIIDSTGVENEITSEFVSQTRGSKPDKLRRNLTGDLDNITLMALRKEPQSRYASVQQFADDIRRHLDGMPVLAHRGTVRYRAFKFVNRHRFGVGVAIAAVLVLLSFAIAMGVQAARVARERDRANREAEASKRVAEFMANIFKVSDPNEARGKGVSAREVLDKASNEIDPGLAKDPELQIRMMHVMGRAYLNLGLYPSAQSLFERGIKISSSASLQENRETLLTMHDLAWALFQQGHVAEAEDLARRTLSMQQRVLGSDHSDTLATMGELAFTLCEEGKCAEGVKLNREVLEKQKHVLGPEAFYTLVTMDNLAIMLAESGNPADAEKLEREALAIHVRVFGPEDLATIHSTINLADFLRDLGRDQEAEKLLRQALEIEGRVLGPNQPETAATKYDLACILTRGGQTEEALSLLRQAVDHGLPPRIAAGIDKDQYFQALHDDPRFAALVAHVRELNSTQRK